MITRNGETHTNIEMYDAKKKKMWQNRMDYVVIGKNGGKQLEAYTGNAAVNDNFMDNEPYEERGEYINSLLRERGIEDGLLQDLS